MNLQIYNIIFQPCLSKKNICDDDNKKYTYIYTICTKSVMDIMLREFLIYSSSSFPFFNLTMFVLYILWWYFIFLCISYYRNMFNIKSKCKRGCILTLFQIIKFNFYVQEMKPIVVHLENIRLPNFPFWRTLVTRKI
jgi:hypothetical protein